MVEQVTDETFKRLVIVTADIARKWVALGTLYQRERLLSQHQGLVQGPMITRPLCGR